MPAEPLIKRTFAFVDGQNLFRSAKEAFGYPYPNYDAKKLAETICTQQGWHLERVNFYTGVPNPSDDPFWNHFWNAKLAQMGRRGVHLFSRPLRYSRKIVPLPDGGEYTFIVGREKGVDVRLALDVVHAVRKAECSVALVFSQDQDLSELADEIRLIAREQNRWVKIASAFPSSPMSTNRRGIDRTDWIRIDRATYDTCIDPRDYRPRPQL